MLRCLDWFIALINSMKLNQIKLQQIVLIHFYRFYTIGDFYYHTYAAWKPCDVILCHSMLCYATLCYVMPLYAMLYYVMLCYAMICYGMLFYASLCYTLLCYAMLCYVMLHLPIQCYIMPLYAILCSNGRSTTWAYTYPMLYVCIAPWMMRVSPIIIAIFAAFRYSVIRPPGRIKSKYKLRGKKKMRKKDKKKMINERK